MKTTKNIALIKFIYLLFLGMVVVPLHATTTLNASQTALRVKPLATMTHLTDDVAGYTKLASIAGDDIYIIENGIAKRKTLEIYKNADGVLAWRALANAGDDWFSLSSFKNISAKIPGGANKTNIGKTLWDDAYKITPTNGSSVKNIIDDIIANGDTLGTKTEGLVDDIMTGQGYQIADGKYFGTNGTNGYDGVYYKGTLDNPTEIIIIESKQMSATGSATLGNSNPSTGLPSQMSDPWIRYIAEQKLMNLGGDKTKLANTIINSPPNFVQKYVSAVDKSTGEINFLKLANY